MVTLIVIVALATTVQMAVCGFSFSLLLCIISRIMFILKLYGVDIKLKVMIIIEGVSLLWSLMIPFLFKWPVNWTSFIVQLVMSCICIIVEWYNDNYFLYYEEIVEKKKERNDHNDYT